MNRTSLESQLAASQDSAALPWLADLAVDKLAPVAAEMRRILADPAYIDGVLREGGQKAGVLAEDTMKGVRDIIGLLND